MSHCRQRRTLDLVADASRRIGGGQIEHTFRNLVSRRRADPGVTKMHIDFSGKQVMVTGAVRGIGRGITHAFAERGAHVTACDVLADGLAETVATAPTNVRDRITAAQLDVTDSAAVAAVVADIEQRSSSGAVDVLVHSAGGVVGQQKQPIESVSDTDWAAIQSVNVTGAFHCVRAATPGMKHAQGGRIVIISSRAGLGVSLTGIASYGTAKAAQIGLVRQLAHELGPFGITVNSVAPGFICAPVQTTNASGSLTALPARRQCSSASPCVEWARLKTLPTR